MKTKLEIEAAEILPQEIGNRVLAFERKCVGVAEMQVDLTNEARLIGLMIQQWTGGHQQISFEFFQRHERQLPKECTFERLKTFTHIANRLPQPATRVEQTRQVWQLEFQAGGVLEPSHRVAPQQRAITTPYTQFVNAVGDVRNIIVRWNRDQPIDSWDDETRASVKAQLQPLIELHQRL